MQDRTVTVRIRDSEVRALRTPASRTPELLFVYAPGAGSNLNDPFGAYLAPLLAEAGIETWRFEFPYMAAGKKRPGAPALLAGTWNAVLQAAMEEAHVPVVVGGRSMGGRIASMVVAAGAAVQGLALFAYPLIPPGRSGGERSEHLPGINLPVLFCSGTRDAFATPDQLRAAAALVPDATVHLLEGADHGFATLKSSGRTREDVWHEAAQALLSFLQGLPGGDGVR